MGALTSFFIWVLEELYSVFQSRRKANTYRNFIIFFAFLALLLILLGSISSFVGFFTIAGSFSAAVPIYLLRNLRTWNIGAQGEEKVAEYLSHLDGSYSVINDVVLPGMKGNIDHVIIGPEGVFVIETKNQNGLIRCDGDSWIRQKIGRRGTPYFGDIGSPSKQVKRNAMLLKSFIQDRFGTSPYVNGLVVFTSENAVLKIINPTVTVLRPQEIEDFLKNYRSKTPQVMKPEELETIIKPYSHFCQ